MSLTALAFLLLFGAGCSAALFIRPIYGLYLYIAVFYLDPPSRWWSAGLPSLRWSLLAAAVTLLAMFIHRDSVKKGYSWTNSTIAKILILYTVWMWIQWPWVISPLQLEGTILYTKYCVLFYLMYQLIDSEETFQQFCVVHVMGCAYLGWLIYLAPDAGRLESVGGSGIGNANTLGMHIGTGLIIGGFLLFTLQGWIRWLVLAVMPLIVNGIFQTETRGAFVGLFVAGVVAIYLKPKSIRKKFYALAILGVVASLSIANEALLSRLSTMQAAVDEEAGWDNSALSRVAIAQSQLRIFADHPFGVGHQGTAILSTQYIAEEWLDPTVNSRSSHNTVLTVLVDQGLPGIILLTILAFHIIGTLRRLKALDRYGLPYRLAVFRAMIGAVIASILAAGMFAQYFKAEVLIWALILLAVLQRLSEDAQKTGGQLEGSAQAADSVSRVDKRIRSHA